MTTDSMKWWGWGDPAKSSEIGPEAIAALRSELGEAEPASRVALDQVVLPEPTPLPEAIVEAVGQAGVLTGIEDRMTHAAGRSYPDLVRLRAGELERAPDAVVLPANASRGRARAGDL